MLPMESELGQQSLVQLHFSELSSKHFSSVGTDLESQGTFKLASRKLFSRLVSNKKISELPDRNTGNSLSIRERQKWFQYQTCGIEQQQRRSTYCFCSNFQLFLN